MHVVLQHYKLLAQIVVKMTWEHPSFHTYDVALGWHEGAHAQVGHGQHQLDRLGAHRRQRGLSHHGLLVFVEILHTSIRVICSYDQTLYEYKHS